MAGCLGTDSLDCVAGMMALLLRPLLQALACCPFVAELDPDRPGSWCSGPPGWKLISSCHQKAAHPNSGVPPPPDPNLDHFPFSSFCFRGPVPFFCPLNGLTPHPLRRMRVWLLFEDKLPYNFEHSLIKTAFLNPALPFLSSASLNPYTTMSFKGESFLMFQT